MAWEVRFFQTSRGTYPVKEFINEQDETTYVKIARAMNLLITGGPYLKPPYIKKLQDNLYELRISGKVALRIFYTLVNEKYYLLHIFKKKTQKTPLKELQIAIDRMKTII